MTKVYTTLVKTEELAEHLDDPNWVVVDCRFSMAAVEHSYQDYLKGHIPGAVYVSLHDLVGPISAGKTGRHPLPGIEQACQVFSRLGIGEHSQVVAYDDAGGAMAASRFWWMLRWLGHEAAAVLDGGWQNWLRMNLPVNTGLETNPPREFVVQVHPEHLADAAEVDVMRQDPACKVFDSRAAERYRGENETIDPVAGHIPGAFSSPYVENLNPDGTFRTSSELRQRFEKLLNGTPAERTAFYCGSGVTANHNILAMYYAGLGESRLYTGSWSEWITDPRHPIARGATP